jgi:hypothetical protein
MFFSDLARKLGVSRVRISLVLNLLKLDDKLIKVIEKLVIEFFRQNSKFFWIKGRITITHSSQKESYRMKQYFPLYMKYRPTNKFLFIRVGKCYIEVCKLSFKSKTTNY